MNLIKPLRPGVLDTLTGKPLPAEGVQREVLLPPDHYAQRTGDLSIEPIAPATEPAKATPRAAKL